MSLLVTMWPGLLESFPLSKIPKPSRQMIGPRQYCMSSTTSTPTQSSTELKKTFAKLATTLPLALSMSSVRKASAADSSVPSSTTTEESGGNWNPESMPLGKDAYTDLGGKPMCRILNGMWQVSGAHGYEPQKEKAVAQMAQCAG